MPKFVDFEGEDAQDGTVSWHMRTVARIRQELLIDEESDFVILSTRQKNLVQLSRNVAILVQVARGARLYMSETEAFPPEVILHVLLHTPF